MHSTAPTYIPAYYADGEPTSRDCWSCTAYRADNALRVEHLPPHQRVLVEDVLTQWRAVVRADMQGA
jgi:hypothetical protein